MRKLTLCITVMTAEFINACTYVFVFYENYKLKGAVGYSDLTSSAK